jgi:hypothetical protein
VSSFNKAFEAVTLVDDTVTVHGKSATSDPHDEIHVALMQRSGGAPLLTQVEPSRSAMKWPATFPGAAPPFAVGDHVFVVGISVRPAPAAPFVWKGSFKIEEG